MGSHETMACAKWGGSAYATVALLHVGWHSQEVRADPLHWHPVPPCNMYMHSTSAHTSAAKHLSLNTLAVGG